MSHKLIDVCMSFNRRRPEFHTLVIDAPLSAAGREEKQALRQVFVDFITARLRRELPAVSRSQASHHGQLALMIFRGSLDKFTTAPPSSRRRLQQAIHDAILRYLEPVLTQKESAPPKRSRSQKV